MQNNTSPDRTIELMIVVPFCLGAILYASAEYVPGYTETLMQVAGGLVILGVCMFFGANGIIIVWSLLPRFHQAIRQKGLWDKLFYITFLIAGISFIFWCISLLFALWHSAMRA